jgi:hypothetical protein
MFSRFYPYFMLSRVFILAPIEIEHDFLHLLCYRAAQIIVIIIITIISNPLYFKILISANFCSPAVLLNAEFDWVSMYVCIFLFHLRSIINFSKNWKKCNFIPILVYVAARFAILSHDCRTEISPAGRVFVAYSEIDITINQRLLVMCATQHITYFFNCR